jgi:signal transduction histidine kinase
VWVNARVADPVASISGGFYAVVFAATGAVLVHLRPRNAIGWLLVLTGLLQALSVGGNAYGSYGVDVAEPAWPLAPEVAQATSMVYLPSLVLPATVLVALYPSGRLPARWWRWPMAAVSAGLAVVTVVASLDQQSYDDIASGPAPVTLPQAWLVVIAVPAVGAVLGGALTIWVATVVRLVRARPPERQQLAWLVCIVFPLMVATFTLDLPEWAFVPLVLMVPGSILIGVVRYRLLGIVVSRALVYGTLTVTVVVLYLAVAAVAAAALGRTLSPVPGAVAAALLAVTLSPARTRLQSTADQFVYGRRRDPVAAVTELGDRVATAEEAELLPAVLDTVTAALRAPGARVVRAGEPAPPDGGTVAVPLRVAGRDVGTLHVDERHPGEPFTAGDRRLLAALAPQVAVVVRALELAGSLERERDRVLTATHAERDRIRRDLHDGLGPALAGISLGVQAVQAHLGERADPSTGGLLARLKDGVDAAVGEVRRILDGLRPGALDDVGFVAAVRRHADAVAPSVPVRVTAEELPPLPPDVETAAYRITQEALTNVARHSGARSAQVQLRARDGWLEVAVVDDGTGFEPGAGDDRPAGVGLPSMRTRAQAVGGELTVTSGSEGTRVLAGLPLGERP